MKKRSGWQVPAVLGGVAVLAVSLKLCNGKEAPSAAYAPTDQTTTSVPTAPPVAPTVAAPVSRLPPEPPPSYPEGASEVPKLEEALAANAVYSAVWEPSHQEHRVLLLSGLSALLADGGLSGPIRESIDAKRPVREAAIKLYLIFARTGQYPKNFTESLHRHLEMIRDQAYHGVWMPYRKGQTPHDFSALAMWLNRDQPEYVREFLAAKKDGPTPGWFDPDPKKPPERPYMVVERLTLERLSLMTSLTDAELAHLKELRANADAMKVLPEDIMAEYKSNEVRGDMKYKGKLVRVRGAIGPITKDVTGSIHLDVAGIHCMPDSDQVEHVAALSRGDTATVRGKVVGLVLGNVVLDHCEIAQ